MSKEPQFNIPNIIALIKKGAGTTSDDVARYRVARIDPNYGSDDIPPEPSPLPDAAERLYDALEAYGDGSLELDLDDEDLLVGYDDNWHRLRVYPT